MSRAPLRTQRTSHRDQNQRNRRQKLHANILRPIRRAIQAAVCGFTRLRPERYNLP
jgi:hypothetical protein